MPEGDTVYRAAKLLDRHLTGHELVATDFRVPQHATVDLSGGTVVGTLSRGKHLLTRIDRDGPDGSEAWTLHTHLKMEGAWRVLKPRQRWPRPAHQARVVLTTETAVAVGFSLGIVELVQRTEEEALLAYLGPDLLGPDWDADEALRRLEAEPDRPIREALLDQRNLAGIGNMYAAELCFVAGVHPLTPVSEVRDLRRLVARAQQMLSLNKERALQSTTGNLRDGQRLWVYSRGRSPCLRCRTPVAVEAVDGGVPGRSERPMYWCPRCQPAATA
jgi:endonuclease-8